MLTGLVVTASTMTTTTSASAAFDDTAWETSTSPLQGGPTTSQTFRPPETDLILSGTAATVSVDAVQPGWHAAFQAPDGQPLIEGRSYPMARAFPSDVAGHPGMLVSGDSVGCSGATGSFHIYELEIDPSTGAPTRLSVSFFERCEDEQLVVQGDIRVAMTNPAITRTNLALSTFPVSPAPLSTVTIKGLLTAQQMGLVGADVVITRHDGTGDTTTALTTDFDGAFSMTSTAGSGDTVYTADYLGTSDFTLASEQITIKGVKEPTSLTLTSEPSSATPGTPVLVSGTVEDGDGPVEDAWVSITRDAGTGALDVGGVRSDAHGVFTSPSSAGSATTTYTATFDGDPGRQSSQASAVTTVVVERRATDLTVRTGQPVYSYGSDARVVIRVGGLPENRIISVFANRRGPGAGGARLIAKENMDVHGKLVIRHRITGRTTFTASFAGDERYLPATASATATASSKLSLALSRYAARDGSDYRYRKADPVANVTVWPRRERGCARLVVQKRSHGEWVKWSATTCAQLDANSQASIRWQGRHHTGTHYRMRAAIEGSVYAASGASPWRSFSFR